MSILEEIAILNNSKAGNFDDEGMEIYVAENTEVDDSENGDELSIHALEGDLAMENQGGVDNQEEFVRRDDLEIVDHRGNFLRMRKGTTRPKDVWNLPITKRIKIHCNFFGKLVKKGGGILRGWLGSYARKASLCTVNYINWRKMPRSLITMLLKQTWKRFFLPQDSKVNGWIKKKTGRNRKNYRYKLKRKYMHIALKHKLQTSVLPMESLNNNGEIL